MTQSYVKPCIYCKERIEMSDKVSGKWLPYDLDGSAHECKTQTGTKKVEAETVTLAQVNTRLKVLEKMLLGNRV